MAQIVYNPVFQAFDDAGDPLNGGLLYTYAAGTTTPKSTWADAGENTLNANPIELDSRGEAIIYGSGAYKFVLHTALDAPIWTADDVAVGGTVVTADIADGAVTTPKLASNALSADVSGRSKMQDGFVTSAKLAVVAVPNGSTATTQSASDNSTKLATTAYADGQSTLAYNNAIAQARLYDGVRETLATVTSTAGAVIPDDDTVPDITEGTEIFSVSYTPTSAAIDLAIDAFIPGCGNDNYERIAAVFVGSTCISAVSVYGASNVNIILACSGIYSPANTSALTISVRVGSTAAVNFYVNGGDNSGNRKLGGATKSTLTIREITR